MFTFGLCLKRDSLICTITPGPPNSGGLKEFGDTYFTQPLININSYTGTDFRFFSSICNGVFPRS